MTSIGRAVLLASGIFYLVGVINQNDSAFVVCWAGFSIAIACFLLSRASLSGVDVRCDSPGRKGFSVSASREGQSTSLRLILDNRGSLNKTGIGFTVQFLNVTQDRIHQRSYGLDILRGNEHFETATSVPGLQRGRHQVTQFRLRGSDPLGLFHFARTISVDLSFLIFPRVFTVHSRLHRSGDSQRQPGRMELRRSGPSPEFFGVREYQPGDDLRWVHWPATARRGKLIIREFEATIQGSNVLCVDLWSGQQFGSGPDSSLEWQLRIAASLAYHQLSANRTLSLIGTSTPLTSLPASRGHHHIHKIMEALATTEANGRFPLHEVLPAQSQITGNGGLTVITADVHGIAKLVRLLKKRNSELTVILLDPQSFESPSGPRTDDPDFDQAVAALHRSGIETWTFRLGDSVVNLLTQVDRRRGRVRNAERMAAIQSERSGTQ